MEFLSKIAAVFVTLLLYFVIAILQMPRPAHATQTGVAAGAPQVIPATTALP